MSTDSLVIADTGSTNGSPYEINIFQRTYASIELTAKSMGSSGNLITLEYSGSGSFPALMLSGQSLSGGADTVKAKGTITLINNDISGYTLTIGGVGFIEGTHFTKGTSSAATAANLIAAINGSGAVLVSSAELGYDVLINDLETLVFHSEQAIPFFEQPKLNIELQQASNNQKIVANLPNPSHGGIKKKFADQIESEVYVFI